MTERSVDLVLSNGKIDYLIKRTRAATTKPARGYKSLRTPQKRHRNQNIIDRWKTAPKFIIQIN